MTPIAHFAGMQSLLNYHRFDFNTIHFVWRDGDIKPGLTPIGDKKTGFERRKHFTWGSMDSSTIEFLTDLDLARYTHTFDVNGFDDLSTLSAICEADLCAMGVRLGDRRKIQRALFRLAGGSDAQPLPQLERIRYVCTPELPNRQISSNTLTDQTVT